MKLSQSLLLVITLASSNQSQNELLKLHFWTYLAMENGIISWVVKILISKKANVLLKIYKTLKRPRIEHIVLRPRLQCLNMEIQE